MVLSQAVSSAVGVRTRQNSSPVTSTNPSILKPFTRLKTRHVSRRVPRMTYSPSYPSWQAHDVAEFPTSTPSTSANGLHIISLSEFSRHPPFPCLFCAAVPRPLKPIFFSDAYFSLFSFVFQKRKALTRSHSARKLATFQLKKSAFGGLDRAQIMQIFLVFFGYFLWI